MEIQWGWINHPVLPSSGFVNKPGSVTSLTKVLLQKKSNQMACDRKQPTNTQAHIRLIYECLEMYRHVYVVRESVTHFINVACGGFGWRFALRCGSVHGLSPDGAGWPAGLHRSVSTTAELKASQSASCYVWCASTWSQTFLPKFWGFHMMVICVFVFWSLLFSLFGPELSRYVSVPISISWVKMSIKCKQIRAT